MAGDVASVPPQIGASCQPRPIPDQTSRLREVEMPPATAGPAFYRRGYAAVLPFEVPKADITAVSDIDIDHDKAGDRTRHDTDPSIGPHAKPPERRRLIRVPVLKLLPPDEQSLVTRPDRDDRPASSDAVSDRLVHHGYWASRSTAVESSSVSVIMIAPPVMSSCNPRASQSARNRPVESHPALPDHLDVGAEFGPRDRLDGDDNRRQRSRHQPQEHAPTAPHTVKQAALWSPSHPKHEGRQRVRSDSRAAPPTNGPRPAQLFQAPCQGQPGRLAPRLGSAVVSLNCAFARRPATRLFHGRREVALVALQPLNRGARRPART